MDSDSDSSSLSSAPEEEMKRLAPIFMKAKKATKLAAPPPVVSPPRPKRPPSPPHEEVMADNPDIAFIVMFRSRFHEAFPTKLPNYGPQDIEFGVVDVVPSPQIESLLCALLGLVLNRKKPVERGHHGRALEEAVASHKSQWPRKWNGHNPLHGGKDFNNMSPSERLNLLRTLAMWALSSSEVITNKIKDSYKQTRHNDDENQALSVQYWGLDGDKRRYYLIQGMDDTSFRVYREGNRHTRNAHWWSVAGSIDEVKVLAEKLETQDGTQAARRLSVKITNAIPMFEATEEKRRRREYRQQRRAAFSRPEPGFGIYEGRTRGKRLRYNYDEDDSFLSDDDTSARRSTRHQSARSTPSEAGPTFTASGRQVKQPRTGDYSERLVSGHSANDGDGHDVSELDGIDYGDEDSDPIRTSGRATRSGGTHPAPNGTSSNLKKRKQAFNTHPIDDLSNESDSQPNDGDDVWNSDNSGDDDPMLDDEDDVSSHGANESAEDFGVSHPQCLIVRLKVSADVQTAESPPSIMEHTATMSIASN